MDTEEKNVTMLTQCAALFDPEWQVISYQTPFALVTAIHDEFRGEADVLMLRVYREEDEGILLGKELQSFFPQLRLVFYSETYECAEAIFDACPLYFLKLPFQRDRIRKAFGRIAAELRMDAGQLFSITHKGQLFRIRFSSIRYLESVGRKIVVYTDAGSYETYLTMDEAGKRLPDYLVRCHRSYIVNQNRVKRHEADAVFLFSGESVPVSRSYQKEIRKLFRND